MKNLKTTFYTLLGIGLLFTCFACRPVQDIEKPPQTTKSDFDNYINIKNFDEMMNLKPEWIDIPMACFMLEKEYGFSTDEEIAKASIFLDELTKKAKYKIRNYYPPDRKVRFLLQLIFDSGFRTDITDPEGHNLENLFLSTVLKRKKGYCLSLSILALSIAYRLDRDYGIKIPIKGIRAPKHFFIRLVSENKSEETNYEMTDFGMVRENTDFLDSLDIPLVYMGSKVFFKPLTSKQIFSDFLSNLGAKNVLEKDFFAAKHWLEKAIHLDNSNPQPYHNLGIALENQQNYTGALKNLTQALNLDPNFYDSLCARGNIYCEKGNPREGLKDFEVATKKYKNRYKAFLLRGVYFGKQENYIDAEIDLLRAKKLNPLEIDVNINLAVLNIKQEKYNAALPYLELLTKIAPEHEEYKNWEKTINQIKQINKME